MTSIGSTTNLSNTAQIAALEKQLAQYEKQLQADDASHGTSSAASAQLVATQITLVETEIAALNRAGAPSTASSTSARGSNINVTA